MPTSTWKGTSSICPYGWVDSGAHTRKRRQRTSPNRPPTAIAAHCPSGEQKDERPTKLLRLVVGRETPQSSGKAQKHIPCDCPWRQPSHQYISDNRRTLTDAIETDARSFPLDPLSKSLSATAYASTGRDARTVDVSGALPSGRPSLTGKAMANRSSQAFAGQNDPAPQPKHCGTLGHPPRDLRWCGRRWPDDRPHCLQEVEARRLPRLQEAGKTPPQWPTHGTAVDTACTHIESRVLPDNSCATARLAGSRHGQPIQIRTSPMHGGTRVVPAHRES